MKTYALHIRFAKGWTFIQNVSAPNIPEAWAALLRDEKCNIAHIQDKSTSTSFVQWNSKGGAVMYSMRAKLIEVKEEKPVKEFPTLTCVTCGGAGYYQSVTHPYGLHICFTCKGEGKT